MPLKVYILLFLFCSTLTHAWFFNFAPVKPFTLMIEAGGHSANPGRSIDDTFESTITLAFAHALKNRLLEQQPTAKIFINRQPGESIAFLQSANFANKLDVDLYISIHAFLHTESKPCVYMYQFSYHDTLIIKDEGLSFYPLDKIYLINEPKTSKWARTIFQFFCPNPLITTKGIYKIPFRPLLGIKAPALAFEFGLKNKLAWHDCIDILADSLLLLMK